MSGSILDKLKLRPRTLPSTGTNGELSVDLSDNKLKKFNEVSSIWEGISGGSGGSGGINHLTDDDVDAENSVGNWAAYQNLAGEEPVDGFGNSPTVTVARTVTNPLRGAGSFLLTKDGFDRQGEGASVDFSIGRSDALISQRQEVSFEYEGSSNLVVGDGGDLNVFIYDDDTDTLIRPEQIFLTSSTGKYLAHWNIQDDESRNYRLILHISTTSTLAWTFKFDQVSVGPQSTIVGPAMTDWTDFPMVITATVTNPTKGTIVTDSAFWRRVGDSMEIRYDYQQSAGGTAGTGSSYIFGLPSGYAADTQKVFLDLVNNDLGKVGDCNTFDGTSREHGDVKLISATGLNLIVFNQTNGYGNVAPGRVDLSNATVRYTFTAKVPISGWTSNVSVGNGQTFKISNVIANGTRVTSTPAKLGEWRSQLRNAGARTFTDTNGEPSSLPSAANGIKVFHSASFATADSNNEPSRYEIFLGKNKQIKMESYLNTGRTGFHDPSPHIAASLENIGYVTNYDPASGVFVITPVLYQANNNRTGFQSDGDVTSSDWFMDLVVSENVQAIAVDLAHSEVWVYSASGYGSTNTKIRTFGTVGKNEGNAITYASDGTNGDSFTINESGVYSMHYHDQFSAASNFGISLNSNQLTTNLVSITAANRLIGVNTSAAGAIGVASSTVKLSRGDVIRAHGDAITTGGSTWGDGFRITKV
jgi:hypothetical protein